MRRFSTPIIILSMLIVYMIPSLCIALALLPGVCLVNFTNQWNIDSTLLKHFVFAFSLVISYLLYGISLIFILPAMNFLIRAYPRPCRENMYSIESVRWFTHNALTYVMRYTFLDWITPTPLNVLFYKLMGMKVGKGVHINSSNISDPSLISLGNKVVVGGSASIMAHYGQKGVMIIAPVKIDDKATIGIRATIMGDVEIGKGATVLPNSAVMPKTRILDGEVWGGVPAVKLS